VNVGDPRAAILAACIGGAIAQRTANARVLEQDPASR
jgi:hypothetical protein